MQTPAQRFASRRNFRLFQAQGALANLKKALYSETDYGVQTCLESVVKQLEITVHLMKEKYKRRKV